MEDTHVYMLDAIGLLDEWFPAAECIIMGGTFVDIGGHNLIEPLAFSKAVVYGQHMHNFQEMNQLVCQHNAAVQVEDYDAMYEQVQRWMQNRELLKQQEQRAIDLSDSLNATLDDYMVMLTRQIEDQDAE
jgi:3-deoxy-D-manno-octulosonic-acid transferase